MPHTCDVGLLCCGLCEVSCANVAHQKPGWRSLVTLRVQARFSCQTSSKLSKKKLGYVRVAGAGCQFLPLNRHGDVRNPVRVSALTAQLAVVRAQTPLTDDQIEAIESRYGDRRGGILYERLWGFLGVDPPADHVDPESQFVQLPQPYRLVDEIVRSIVDDAYQRFAVRAARPNVWQAKSRLASVGPSSTWTDGVGAPTAMGTDSDGRFMFVGNASGRVLAVDPSDPGAGIIDSLGAFACGGGGSGEEDGAGGGKEAPEAASGGEEGTSGAGAFLGGVTSLPATIRQPPLPMRGEPTDTLQPGTSCMDPFTERGWVVPAASCLQLPRTEAEQAAADAAEAEGKEAPGV